MYVCNLGALARARPADGASLTPMWDSSRLLPEHLLARARPFPRGQLLFCLRKLVHHLLVARYPEGRSSVLVRTREKPFWKPPSSSYGQRRKRLDHQAYNDLVRENLPTPLGRTHVFSLSLTQAATNQLYYHSSPPWPKQRVKMMAISRKGQKLSKRG